MNIFSLSRFLAGVFMFWIAACAAAPRTISPYFEMPPDHLLQAERELFASALRQQKNNKLDSSINLWKRFLKNNPRSFRGYNNLGMAHYTNDRLSASISAFETGLALEPSDHKIKENLKRTLRFQVTLLRENKDYDAAIRLLKRVSQLSKEPELEKVALEIETLEDRIFEQVKRSNTLEDYEVFLARYPNSPKNSDEARRQIAQLKPQQPPTGEMPTMERGSPSASEMELEAFPGSMETPEPFVPDAVISEETIEIVAEPESGTQDEATQKEDEFPEGEPALDPEPILAEEPPKEEEPPVKEKMPEIVKEQPAAKKPVKKVKIITKTTSLRVRADPSIKAEIIEQLPTAAIVPMFQETGEWYQVEYLPGKKGWISKKYSQPAE